MKRVWALVLVLAMLAFACGGSEEADETTQATEATETPSTDAAQGGGGTLQAVLDRGMLKCGVSTVAPGFAEPQDDGSFIGFDADYCRALAAAIFGDASKVEFRGTTAAERFTVLANGEVDVLFRATTWTQERDSRLGGDFGPTTFFDGQQLMGTTGLFSVDSTLADIDGSRLCTNAGTTTEQNITEGARALGAEIILVTTETVEDAIDLLEAGSCDLVTSDGSALFGSRSSRVSAGTVEEGAWVIFPATPISKEPLGPMYRPNDSQWADVVNWLVYALIIADEKGITAANAADRAAAPLDQEEGRLLGSDEGEHQTSMGLEASAFLWAIQAVGNYDELYRRNLEGLGFVRAGSANARWSEGGLQYAPPAR